jgi:hypothetical protein
VDTADVDMMGPPGPAAAGGGGGGAARAGSGAAAAGAAGVKKVAGDVPGPAAVWVGDGADFARLQVGGGEGRGGRQGSSCRWVEGGSRGQEGGGRGAACRGSDRRARRASCVWWRHEQEQEARIASCCLMWC